MNKRHLIALTVVSLFLISAGIAWSQYQNDAQENVQPNISPCTGAVVEEVPPTPCVIDTHEVPESGQGFYFRYPDDAGVIQSSDSVSTIEYGLADEADQEIMDGPFYLITLHYGDTVSADAFRAMFANSTITTFAGKSALKSTKANFPNPEYPSVTAYYLENNGKNLIAIIAGYDRDMLVKAEKIFTDGFRWEDDEPRRTSFDFTLKYGVDAANVVNTFDDTITKDLIVDPSVTIALKLSDEEIATLQARAHELNLFEDRTVQTNMLVAPCDDYDLTLEENGTLYHVAIDCDDGESNPGLVTFTEEVRALIESKNEYKALPEPRGAYM